MQNKSGIEGTLRPFHILVIILSLAMTVGAWLYSKRQEERQVESRFEAAKNSAIGLIQDRMSKYEDALWSGVAFIDANGGSISMTQWRTFAGSLNLQEKYPGVNGIGYIPFVDRGDLSQYLQDRGAEERPFAIYPEHQFDFLLPITFIEPENINKAAIGLDVAHETNRRTGLLAARDTGTAQITGPIVLVQDSDRTPGFLFYTPIYRSESTPPVELRQEEFLGVVYAPFVVRNLVHGLLSKELREVRFSLMDGDQVIYDEHEQDEPLYDAQPMFNETVQIEMYGRQWTVDIRTNLAFRAQNSSAQSTFILIGGLLIEILVITLLALLTKSNHKAHRLADRLTTELRAKTENLEKANAEIEQFVYVASHDLKTPVRGIGFLADVMEEDLEEILGSLDKHQELKTQFSMIRERVARMNDLTRGIMDYSRVMHGKDEAPELPLQDVIDDCVADFEVEAWQIEVRSDVPVIQCDTHNFRRIVENLVGNAFKYHPERSKAKVEVVVKDLHDRLSVSVKDNGLGIAPEYHERIFDVFQTLRSGNQKESTGIGLAIVKKAVERHGFTVSLDSSVNNGAVFEFCWPKHLVNVDGNVDRAA